MFVNMRRQLIRLVQHEDLNFLLTNRIPRIQLTRFMGWFSRIENPLVRHVSMAVWKLFADLDLSDAKQTKFSSLHDCFTRELRPGARSVDQLPYVLTSPCDALVGACGSVRADLAYQAKGFDYSVSDLLGDRSYAQQFEGGVFVTLRLTSSMYHRFHAPHDCTVERVVYFSGDTWNVNPIALRRIERLFCKNERALLATRMKANGQPIALVAVAAVLVASIRLKFVDVALSLRYRGPNVLTCSAEFSKGQEMGGFEHGSTILVFAPPGIRFADGVREGRALRQGEPLFMLTGS